MRDHRGEKVAIGTPYGAFDPHYVQSMVHLLAYDANHHGRIVGGGASILYAGSSVANNRNQIVRQFLDNTEADWLWWIDSDMAFPPDIVDRLVESADPTERPIFGALCFAVLRGHGQEVVPTLYALTDDDPPLPARVMNLPPKPGIYQFSATGAGCVLVHRTVYETVAEHRASPDVEPFSTWSFPWYQDSPWQSNDGTADVMGEDLTFCYRAAAAGIPTHVDTRIECGHVKPHVYTSTDFYAQFGQEPPASTFVVIPMKNRRDLTGALLDQLAEQGGYDGVFLFDNGSNRTTRNWLSTLDLPGVQVVDADGWGIHRMWNEGIRRSLAAAHGGPCNIAILNNDLILGDGFLTGLAAGLRSNPQVLVVGPNYDGRPADQPLAILDGICAGRYDGTGGLPGFAFMVRGEMFARGFPWFDEDLQWFFGDNELVMNVASCGGITAMVTGVSVEHVDGGGQTTTEGGGATHGDDWFASLSPQMQAAYKADEAVFMDKHAPKAAA